MPLVELPHCIQRDAGSVPTNGQAVNALQAKAQKETGGPKAPRIQSISDRQRVSLSREMITFAGATGAGTLSMNIDVRPISAAEAGLA